MRSFKSNENIHKKESDPVIIYILNPYTFWMNWFWYKLNDGKGDNLFHFGKSVSICIQNAYSLHVLPCIYDKFIYKKKTT